MLPIDGPFDLEQDTVNTLRIVNTIGEELCQFYCEGDFVTEQTMADSQFVLEACNELWKKTSKENRT